MKTVNQLRVGMAVLMVLAGGAWGDNLYWTNSAGGNWDTSALNWTNASGGVAFPDDGTADVRFTSNVTATVTIGPNMTPASVAVSTTSGTITFTNGPIDGAGALLKTGAGTLALASANAYSGGSTISNTAVLAIQNPNALGSGLLTLAGGTFKLITTAMTFTNAITVTTNATITPDIQTVLTGPLTVSSGMTARISCSAVGANNLLVLPGAVSGLGNLAIYGAAVGITNMNQLPSGNLNLETSGGARGSLVLSDITWATFLAARPNYGTGAGQFQGVSFGARGTPLVINQAPSGIPSAAFLNQTNLVVGSPAVDSNGNLYANAPVEYAIDTVLNAQSTVRVSSQGPGTNATTTGFAHVISGDLTDDGVTKGGLYVVANGQVTTDQNELVLAGANSWHGSTAGQGSGSLFYRSGPGGIAMAVNASTIWLRFDNPARLPTGNGGSAANIVAVGRNSGTVGILFTESSAGAVYEPDSGYRFVLGDAGTPYFGGHGLVGESAMLRNTSVLLQKQNMSDSLVFRLLVRGGGLALGDSAKPVNFVPSYNTDTTTAGDVNSAASSFSDATGTRTLTKVGTGTLVLGNIAYTKVDGTGDTSSQYSWQITGGAVRGLADGDAMAGNSNSLKNFNINLNGGVYEVDGRGSASSFTRATGTGANQVQWGSGSGFSAYNGPLTVNIGGAGASFTALATMQFGSQSASDAVTLANPVFLNTVSCTIQVNDNPNSGNDLAVISGVISNGVTARSMTKTGTGTLALNNSNTYTGPTIVSNGTLLINGSLAAGSSVTNSGGTLGGTGTIYGAVRVLSNATIMGGTAGSVGTLTISNNLVLAEGSVINCDIMGGTADRIAVTNGTLTLPTNAVVNVTLSGTRPGSVTLLSASSLVGVTNNPQLPGWSIPAPNYGYSVGIQGNNVVLTGPSQGTVFKFR
jgi:fibronectin-binding autotransporter adhesin